MEDLGKRRVPEGEATSGKLLQVEKGEEEERIS